MSENLTISKFNQVKCECGSWHFALQTDDNGLVIELKCCRCRKIRTVKTDFNIYQNALSGENF